MMTDQERAKTLLFSVGEDGKAFTPDDVLPAKSKELPGLRLPIK
jgi:hypothetical protein